MYMYDVGWLFFIFHPATRPSVQISDGGATPTLEQNYTLTCNVSGASVTTYQWRKNGTMLSETGPTLSLSPLGVSDAGRYTCEITVNSMVDSSDVDVIIMGKVEMCVCVCI